MRSSKSTLNLFLLVMLALCSGMRLAAQTITGDIGGTITDPSGAVVVGAQVTATNVATGVKTSTTTNKDGSTASGSCRSARTRWR